MTDFTQGPWFVERPKENATSVYAHGSLVGIFYGENAEANAHLFVAGAGMFAALETVIKNNFLDGESDGVVNAALAKARGET